MHDKLKGIQADRKYMEDAEKAGSQSCVELFKKMKQADMDQVQKIRQHLKAVMEKGKA